MNAMEAHVLLTVAGLVDARSSRLNADKAEAWAEILSDITIEEAQTALREHLRESEATVLPAHILTIVRRHRRAEAERVAREKTNRMLEPSGHAVPMPAELRAQMKADATRAKARLALLRGRTPSRAIPKSDPEFQTRLAEAAAELRSIRETRKDPA